MPLGRARVPFSHSDWIYEIKWDGFRALAYVEDGVCRLVSRNGNLFKSCPALTAALPDELVPVLLSWTAKSFASTLMASLSLRNCYFGVVRLGSRRLTCCGDGEDLRSSTLIERKARLRAITPQRGAWLLYSGHIECEGAEFFKLACEHDLEGIVAKHRFSPYILDSKSRWLKIRNTDYSQWAGREELFERERANDPDSSLWGDCALACAAAAVDMPL